ncbi:hypothetical protein GJW-30_1_00073 [Variibacter gotjawalensis]|uniref:Glycosyltransferase RgtA/B/C/D-like domain-containing protein n=1 Tax=Variibacter gotjawalensis TaxID=1333996 RepID=A0A0S3PNS3_9BRAD|nr:hypothetical protein [Variibacter gotjawalensis]NIK47852.1 hypothetical protein [Variibacter gotjawalensis]RZS49739.1 hypothetical protein EV661_2179 [Variibacter gotjawalensis]BAT57567.1 hypothetical protein GJW-30_1_00073 [Variibacter gotjawalensis]
MTSHSADSDQVLVARSMSVLGVLLGAFLALRVFSPIIVFDELSYHIGAVEFKRWDHWTTLAPVIPQINNFLYLRILNLLYSTGMQLDIAAKLLNVGAFVGAVVALFRIIFERRENQKLLAAALITMPLITYVSYIMPEMAYLFIFALICIFLHRFHPVDRLSHQATLALLFSALCLIKPHGAMLFGGFILSIITYRLIFERAQWTSLLSPVAKQVTLFVAAFFALKFLFAPKLVSADASAVGPFYLELFRNAVPTSVKLKAFAYLLLCYSMYFMFLFAPFVFLLVRYLRQQSSYTSSSQTPSDGRRTFLTVFALVSLLIVTVSICYLLSIEPDRIHFRYLNFVFPIIVILAVQTRPPEISSLFAASIAACWIIAAVFVWLTFDEFRFLAADSPELFMFYAQKEFGAVSPSWLRTAVVCIPIAASVAILFFRDKLVTISLVTVMAFSSVGLWNSAKVQRVMSQSSLINGFRQIGDVAKLVCHPNSSIIAAGTAQTFVPLIYSVFRIGVAMPFRVLSNVQLAEVVDKAADGTCVLTTDELVSPRLQPIHSVSLIKLYRVMGPR